jgi:hypothetical protein
MIKRTSRPHRIRVTEAGRLKAECDDLFSRIIRGRGRCELRLVRECTGRPDEAAHIINRDRRSTRWMVANAACACRACHSFAHTAEGREIFLGWAQKRLGPSYDALLIQARQTGAYSSPVALREQRDVLQEILESLDDMRSHAQA